MAVKLTKRQEKLKAKPAMLPLEEIEKLAQHKAEIVRDVVLAIAYSDLSRLSRWEGHEIELNEVLAEPVRFKLIPLRDDVATMTIDRPDKHDVLQDLATKFGGFVLEPTTLVLMSKRVDDLATYAETRLGWVPEPVGRSSTR